MSWAQSVFSSNVVSVGFNDDDGKNELLVEWKSGKVSVYDGVDEGTAHMIANAPSVGKAINQMIKNQYSHRYK